MFVKPVGSQVSAQKTSLNFQKGKVLLSGTELQLVEHETSLSAGYPFNEKFVSTTSTKFPKAKNEGVLTAKAADKILQVIETSLNAIKKLSKKLK